MKIMWTYIVAGLTIFGLMLLVGIGLRASQAGWIPIDTGTFYSLLSLHGVGMITAMAIAGLGLLWYLVDREIHLDERVAMLAFAFFAIGVVVVIVSVVFGHYGALWTMLYPLPFVGTTWPSWATGAWLLGVAAVMLGFMLICAQILGAILRSSGGLGSALGLDYVFGRKAFEAAGKHPPSPQMLAATVVSIDGLIGGASGLLVGIAMIAHWLDPHVVIDPLWAKNLTYQFGHTFANLTMYMAVAGIYVALPICTKRAYHSSIPLVVAWWGTLVFVIIAYFHHLYMDFVQWPAVQYIGEISSYLAAVPVVVVTVFGGLMLIHRSGMKWTLGSMFFFAGMVGWIVGGSAAILDATIPFNVDLHNTLWVPAHFHTYLLEGVFLFILGWVFVSLEQRAEAASNALVRWIVGLGIFGGGALFLISFYVAGAAGVPRRYAVEPAPGPFWAGIATVGTLLILVGVLAALVEGIRLARMRAVGAAV